jgi:hypothetical protein
MYDALNHGARRVCAGRWRRCRCPGPGRAGRIVLAVDVSPSLRSDAPPSSDRLFCHVYGRGEGSGPIDPGLAVLLRRRHRAGLDVVERATRRDPPRPRPRRSRRRARSPTATRSGAPTPLPARRRTARRVTRATSTRRRPSRLAHPGPQWRLLDGHERPFGLLVRPPLLVVMTCWPPYDVHPSGRSYMPVVRLCSSAASQR